MVVDKKEAVISGLNQSSKKGKGKPDAALNLDLIEVTAKGVD